MNLFLQRDIKPMLTFQTSRPFASSDWLYELNLSGIRCIAYLDETSTDLRDTNNQPLLPHFPELSELHHQCKKRCILDGEIILIKNGTINSQELNSRLKNPNAISPLPVTYVAYDLLFLENEPTIHLPLIARKQLLEEVLTETLDITISRYQESNCDDLLRISQLEHLNGVIGKQKSSLYLIQQPTTDWVKISTQPYCYAILCGYRYNVTGNDYFIFGKYTNKQLIYLGQVSTKLCSFDESMFHRFQSLTNRMLQSCPLAISPVFSYNTGLIWFQPSLIFLFQPGNCSKHPLTNAKFIGICDETFY